MDRTILYQGLSLPLTPTSTAAAVTLSPDAWSPASPYPALRASRWRQFRAEALSPGVQVPPPFFVDPIMLRLVRRPTDQSVEIPQQVPSPFVANAWLSEWPGPAWPKYPAARQQDLAFLIWQFPTAFVANGWQSFWDGPPAPKFKAAEQQLFTIPMQQVVVITEWRSYYWDGQPPPRLRVASQQAVALQLWQVPSPATPHGWDAVFPERWRPTFPARLQRAEQNPDAAYIAGIVVYPDGWRIQSPISVRRPFTDKSVTALRLDGVPGLFTSWVSAPDRLTYAKGKPGDVQTPVQQVPSPFVAVAWVAAWDGEPPPKLKAGAQRFDNPPVQQVPSVPEPYGWWELPVLPLPRPGKPVSAAAEALVRVSAPPSGWQPVEAVSGRRRIQPVEVERPQAVSARVVSGWEVVWPQGKRPKPAAGDLAEPRKEPPLPASLVDGAFESFIDYRFRRIVPPPPDFARLFRVTPILMSRPPLLGASTRPTLTGVSTRPTMLAASTRPTLLGASTRPTLLGASTAPNVEGEI